MAKVRDANREEFWRQVVQRRAESGMTIDEFCQREGLKPTTYHYWQRVIKRRDEGPEWRKPKRDNVSSLAAVELVDDRGVAAAVEIIAHNGYVVRVGEQATTEHVRRVLQAVRELG